MLANRPLTLSRGFGQADIHRKILLRACRNCDYEEDATAGLVYRNDLLTISKCVVIRCSGFRVKAAGGVG